MFTILIFWEHLMLINGAHLSSGCLRKSFPAFHYELTNFGWPCARLTQHIVRFSALLIVQLLSWNLYSLYGSVQWWLPYLPCEIGRTRYGLNDVIRMKGGIIMGEGCSVAHVIWRSACMYGGLSAYIYIWSVMMPSESSLITWPTKTVNTSGHACHIILSIRMVEHAWKTLTRDCHHMFFIHACTATCICIYVHYAWYIVQYKFFPGQLTGNELVAP